MDDPNAYQAPNERALASLLGLASPRSGLSMVVYSYQFLTCLVVNLVQSQEQTFLIMRGIMLTNSHDLLSK